MTSYRGSIQDETESVLSKDMPWDTFMTARLITDRDLQLLRRFDKRPKATQATLLDEAGPAYIEVFMTVLRNVTKAETVAYVLALLSDVLDSSPGRASLFHRASDGGAVADPYTPFLRVLQKDDAFCADKACRLLARVLVARPDKTSGADGPATPAESFGLPATQPRSLTALAAFVEWIVAQLRRPATGRPPLAVVAAAASVLRDRAARPLFFRAGGHALLPPLMAVAPAGPSSAGVGGSAAVQMTYEAVVCAWQLCFHRPAAEAMGGAGVVAALVGVLQSATKEKVVRVATLALKTLAGLEGSPYGAELAELGALKTVQTLRLSVWPDEDVTAALAGLEAALAAGLKLLSSFDVYSREVLTQKLDWSPAHTDPGFWRQNVGRFEDKEFQILRVLIKLLESRDPRTLAVACHDIGQFTAYHPAGRQVVAELRGKELAMRLMSHPEPEVQKQALLCTQKLLLNNWAAAMGGGGA